MPLLSAGVVCADVRLLPVAIVSNLRAKTYTPPSSALLYTDTTQRKLVATETDPLEVCYPDDQWIDYEGTSYIFERQAYHTQCVDRHNQHRPFEYGAFMGYYTTGEPCASACVKGDNRSQLKGCYPEDR